MPVPPPTGRLRFREMRPDDAPRVRAMLADPVARRFYPALADPEEAVRWVERQRDRYERHGHGLWTLEALEDGRFVGDCGLTYQSFDGGTILEVGWHLAATERGRGLASEAGAACLRHAFGVLGADEVGSLVHPDNLPSLRVAARLHDARREIARQGERYVLFTTSAAEFAARREA